MAEVQMTLAEAIEVFERLLHENALSIPFHVRSEALATVLRAAKAVSEAPRFDSANLRVRFGKLEEPEIYTIPSSPWHGVRIVPENVL